MDIIYFHVIIIYHHIVIVHHCKDIVAHVSSHNATFRAILEGTDKILLQAAR